MILLGSFFWPCCTSKKNTWEIDNVSTNKWIQESPGYHLFTDLLATSSDHGSCAKLQLMTVYCSYIIVYATSTMCTSHSLTGQRVQMIARWQEAIGLLKNRPGWRGAPRPWGAECFSSILHVQVLCVPCSLRTTVEESGSSPTPYYPVSEGFKARTLQRRTSLWALEMSVAYLGGFPSCPEPPPLLWVSRSNDKGIHSVGSAVRHPLAVSITV